jgi:parallel beta-helix repeat protein
MVADTTWTDGQNGVVLGDNSTNVTLQWGMLNGCGIRFDATDPASYSTLVIDSVTVAGKPFFLLKNVNEHGASITTDAQQALLFRVSNATLINAVMTQSNGITLAFCTNVVIRNCTVTESIEYGVRLVQSQSCTVRDSVFISGRLGVEMWFGGVQNRVENCRFFNCAMAVAVHPLQDQPEVSSNSFEGCSIGIILGGLSAFASDNTLANCSGGAIVVSGGIQSVVVGNTITGGGYGIRMGDNNETMVQLNEISGAVVGIIIDSGNVRMYITGNLVVNCTSHAVRIYGEGNGTYIIGNRFLANNGAGTVYSSSHVQASDSYGYAIWNDTWGNYWSDWTSTSYTIGPYNISSASKDMTPYPMLVCGAPGNLTGKFNANNLTITWAVPTYPGFQEATSYAIYRGDSVGNMTKIATVSGSATSYTDRGLGSSTYYYQISAINPYGEGARSGVLSATQGSPGGVDMTLLIIGLLLVIVAIVIVILLLRNRR